MAATRTKWWDDFGGARTGAASSLHIIGHVRYDLRWECDIARGRSRLLGQICCFAAGLPFMVNSARVLSDSCLWLGRY